LAYSSSLPATGSNKNLLQDAITMETISQSLPTSSELENASELQPSDLAMMQPQEVSEDNSTTPTANDEEPSASENVASLPSIPASWPAVLLKQSGQPAANQASLIRMSSKRVVSEMMQRSNSKATDTATNDGEFISQSSYLSTSFRYHSIFWYNVFNSSITKRGGGNT
jgi:hypothetical protein